MLALPGMLAAVAVLVLDHAIAQRNLFGLLWDLLERALDAFTWAGPVAAIFLIVLLVLGCLHSTRRTAALIVLFLNVAALVVIFARVTIQGPIYEQAAFLPAILSMLIAGGLVFVARRYIETDRTDPPLA